MRIPVAMETVACVEWESKWRLATSYQRRGIDWLIIGSFRLTPGNITILDRPHTCGRLKQRERTFIKCKSERLYFSGVLKDHFAPLFGQREQLLASFQQVGNKGISQLTRKNLASENQHVAVSEVCGEMPVLCSSIGRGGAVWRGTFRLTSFHRSSSGRRHRVIIHPCICAAHSVRADAWIIFL